MTYSFYFKIDFYFLNTYLGVGIGTWVKVLARGQRCKITSNWSESGMHAHKFKIIEIF